MANTTIGLPGLMALGPRLTAAMDVRIEHAGITLTAVARGIGKSDRMLRAWRKGENEPAFSEIERIETFFDALGFPGLMADIRKAGAWRSIQLELQPADLPAIGRKLLDCAADLRAAVSLEDTLAERGLLPHVHIMMRSDTDKVYMTHRGSKMKSARQIDRAIFGRDIRLLAPQGYGIEVYPQVMECLAKERPTLHHISAADMDYHRLAVPVGPFYVAHSYMIEVSPSFALR